MRGSTATLLWLGGIACVTWILLIRPSPKRSQQSKAYRSFLFVAFVLAWSVVLLAIDDFFFAMSLDD
jgi:hypothetical protein